MGWVGGTDTQRNAKYVASYSINDVAETRSALLPGELPATAPAASRFPILDGVGISAPLTRIGLNAGLAMDWTAWAAANPDLRLIWIDLEMTGLDTQNDHIIEIATIITDEQLNILAEGPVLAVHQSDRVLNAMDEWNTRQHGQSGLTERVRRSALGAAEVEQQTLAFLQKWIEPGKSPMCGNSICQDRRFLDRKSVV